MNPRRLLALPLMMLAAMLGLVSCSPEERTFDDPNAPGESCFDGVDDDGDGAVDCADADCTAGAACVATPESFSIGVLVAESEPCPEGFAADDTVLHRGLVDPGCEGCGCTPDPVGCTAGVWYYEVEADCVNDFDQNAGTYAGEYGFTCDANNPISPQNGGLVRGIRTGAYQVTEGCAASGDATPAAPTWMDSRKFCRADRMGAGCEAGQACVPRHEPTAQCALAEGSAACEGYPAAQEWYTGFDDARVCGACTCAASGGSCEGVFVQIGTDYVCTNQVVLGPNDQSCTTIYAPPVGLVGNPIPSTCAAQAEVTGAATPAGPATVCCLQ